jgi:hypothetical protein
LVFRHRFCVVFWHFFNSITELLGVNWKHLLNRYQSNPSSHPRLRMNQITKDSYMGVS